MLTVWNLKRLFGANVRNMFFSPVPGWNSSVAQLIIRIKNHFRAQLTYESMLSLLPLFWWFALFQLYGKVPHEYRRPIDINSLPWLQEQCFGAQVWRLVPEVHWIPVLDLLAALGYFLHFIAPWIWAAYLSITSGGHFAFLWTLGCLNSLAVTTHIAFPTAPPWYLEKFGHVPADWNTSGDPAGLAYADDFLNIRLFRGMYESSPVVFGSFPSLHAAWPLVIAMYAPSNTLLSRVIWLYPLWVWWSALYLRHHFLIDCVGGALYALAAFSLIRIVTGFQAWWSPKQEASSSVTNLLVV